MAFDEEAIIEAFGKEFEALGYSLSYHNALVEASKQTRPESTYKRNMPDADHGSKGNPTFVQEALPKRMKKPKHFKDLSADPSTMGPSAATSSK